MADIGSIVRESCGRYNQNRGRTNFIAGYLMEKNPLVSELPF